MNIQGRYDTAIQKWVYGYWIGRLFRIVSVD